MIQMIVAAEGTISINCHFLFSISGFGTVLILFHTCWHLYQQYFQIVDYVVSSIFSLVYSQVDTFTINISSNAPHSWPLSPTYFVYSLFISCILCTCTFFCMYLVYFQANHRLTHLSSIFAATLPHSWPLSPTYDSLYIFTAVNQQIYWKHNHA